MIALRPAQNLVAFALSGFHLKLPRQFHCGFDRFRSAAGEIHCPATKVVTGKLDQFLRVFFRDRGCELAGVNELQLLRLLHHRHRDLLHSVSDKIHGR